VESRLSAPDESGRAELAERIDALVAQRSAPSALGIKTKYHYTDDQIKLRRGVSTRIGMWSVVAIFGVLGIAGGVIASKASASFDKNVKMPAMILFAAIVAASMLGVFYNANEFGKINRRTKTSYE